MNIFKNKKNYHQRAKKMQELKCKSSRLEDLRIFFVTLKLIIWIGLITQSLYKEVRKIHFKPFF